MTFFKPSLHPLDTLQTPNDTIDVVRHPLDNSQMDSRHPPGTLLTPKPLTIAFNQLS